MESIVEELRREHKELARVLKSAAEAGVASPAGQAALLSIREFLLSHLEKENERIYAPLKAKSLYDQELARIIAPFLARVDEVREFAVEFFERLEREGGGVHFARGAGRLIGMIRNRIHQEEFVIFNEFSKLARTAA